MRKRARPNVEHPWPTPDEIAERAAQVRSEWSARQLRTRAGLSPEENSVEVMLVSPGAIDGRRTSTIDFG
ncbi:MAG TPA: hypothetical protein VNH11_08795 [Pirellulales bacterium]|nr:hypothetical protein [Pirellulales bacterium]